MTRPKGVDLQQFTSRCGVVFKKGASVLIKSEEADKPYIACITDIVQKNNSSGTEVECEVSWYYRPEECWGGRKVFHGEREILASAHKDWVSEHTLEGPCRVHTLGEFQALRCVTATDYFSRTEYRPQALDFRPDRVEVYCVCEMPYNPDQFMVECSLCKEWFHPHCVGVSEDEMARGLWRCHTCEEQPVTIIKVTHAYVPNQGIGRHAPLSNNAAAHSVASQHSQQGTRSLRA